jgi:hypothetical protein
MMLGKHINTVYLWVQQGALPSERIGGTIYIPKWALAPLVSPNTGNELAQAQGASGGVRPRERPLPPARYPRPHPAR